MMKRIFVILFCITFVFLTSCAQNSDVSDSAKAYLESAQKYIDSGDVETAIKALREGLTITGDERIKEKLEELTNKGLEADSSSQKNETNAENNKATSEKEDVSKDDSPESGNGNKNVEKSESDNGTSTNEDKMNSMRTLTAKKAESVLSYYCSSYVNAVNTGDFTYVSPYIRGNLYTSQKGMVDTLYSKGIQETFDYLNVDSVTKVGDNMWKVSVREGETIYYPDGRVSSEQYEWIYTIEYINGKYYPTNIE